MLCEISAQLAGGNLVLTWLAFTLIGFVMVTGSSAVLFYYYYAPSQITYEKWTRKTNPEYPSPEKVRDEIMQMVKGIYTSTMCPAVAVWLGSRPEGVPPFLQTKAFCGTDDGKYSTAYLVGTFLLTWIASDFWEFFYHRLGHSYKIFWAQHRHHHVFFNPSPFAVIADEYVDQFCRSAPLLLFPLLMPVNIDLLFFQFGLFFYIYGCYLHWGYEFDWLDAHQPFINTAYHHYLHHAKSVVFKPYHTGFYFKIWDQLFGSVYKGQCICAACERKAGRRSKEEYAKVHKPNYSVLLQSSFWMANTKTVD